MQQSIKPLTYIEVSGDTVTPGSILTYTGGGNVVMNSVPTELLLDPSGANTLQSIVAAYNSLLWGLYQSGMIITEPRIWFGAAGEGGVHLLIGNDPLVQKYAPYAGRGDAYSYISISDSLTALNRMLGDTPDAQFSYAGGRVSLMVKSDITLQFIENPAAYGSTRRMLNRLFLRDIRSYIGVPLVGPLLIQGDPITLPTYGIFMNPEPVQNIRISNHTGTSFDVLWDESPTPHTYYYVRVEDSNNFNKLFFTPLTSLVLNKSKGIIPNVTYTITVVATTTYEVSTNNNPSVSTSIIIVFPPFTLTVPSLYYKNIDVYWSYVDPSKYSMSIQLNSEAPQIVSADTPRYIGFTNKPPGIYIITALLIDADGYSSQSTSATVELFDIPQPNISLSVTTANSITLIHTLLTPSEKKGIISNIEIKYTENGNTVTVIHPYNDTSITINSLTAFTDYVFELRYVLTGQINKGDPTQITVTTSLPPFALTLGTVTATRITVTWPITTPDYLVTFTAPTSSFDVDAALGTYTFKLLQPTTNYTVTAYLKKNGLQSAESSVNMTTPALPTIFGPINDGKSYSSIYDAVTLNLNTGIQESQFGVTIPDDSIYTTYKFNKIIFPLMSSYGTMINRGRQSAFVKIYIYIDSSRSQTITESDTVEIISAPGLDQYAPYSFTFPVVVTLTKDMCIIPTLLTNTGEVRISYYTYSNGDPLLGLVDSPGNTTLSSTNSIMLFNFVWQ